MKMTIYCAVLGLLFNVASNCIAAEGNAGGMKPSQVTPRSVLNISTMSVKQTDDSSVAGGKKKPVHNAIYASKKYWPYNHLFMEPFPANKEAAKLYASAGRIYAENIQADAPQNLPEEKLTQIIETLEKMNSVYPNHADAYYVLGWALYFYSENFGPFGQLTTEQMFPASEEYYLKAAELKPTDWEIVGTLLYRTDAAFRPRIIELCNRLLKANPDNVVALSNCGQVFIDDGKTKEGLAAIEKALSFPSSDTMRTLGIYGEAVGALTRNGRKQEAKEYQSREDALSAEYLKEKRQNAPLPPKKKDIKKE